MRLSGILYIVAATPCGISAAEVPTSMDELPRAARSEITRGENRHWYCLDVLDPEEVRVVSLDGNPILARLFDAERHKELSAAVATDDQPALIRPSPGHYALSLWSAAGGAFYEIERRMVANNEQARPAMLPPANAAPRGHQAAGAGRTIELMRAAAGTVGGEHGAREQLYRVTVPSGYFARVTSRATGAPFKVEARREGGGFASLAKLETGRYLLRVVGSENAETSYALRLDMVLARLEPDRSSARPLREGERYQVIVGGDRPRAEWLEFVVGGRSRVTLTASRYGAPALLTLTSSDGAHVATMRLDPIAGEMTRVLPSGHYFVRIESDDGAAASVRMRVLRSDPDAQFEKVPRKPKP